MSKKRYRVIIKIDYYVDEIIEAEDELDLQEQVKEWESYAVEHASEDVRTDTECLDEDEEEEDSEPGGDNSESWYNYKNAQEEERASKQ